jgi:hypothetical protein
MTPEQALHTFARRYCIERAGKLKGMRAADYDREFYTVGPRSSMLHVILLYVEMLDFDRLPRVDQLADLLVAGQTARTDVTGSSIPEREERQLFVDVVRGSVAKGLPEQQPLPYRRTLSATEVDELCRKLHATWGFKRGYSYPLEPKSHPSLRAYDLGEVDDSALQSQMKEFLRVNGVRRILELREFGLENYFLDAESVEDFAYTGAEGYWTSEQGDWVVYCSHEATITLGGSITAIAPPERSWDGWHRP